MNSNELANSTKRGKRSRSGLAGLEFYGLRDVKKLLFRRKWVIAATTLTVALTVSVVTYFIPNLYQASALILVDPGKVPENYVKSTATLNANQRLALLQKQILSDSNLGQVIDELGLYRALKSKKPITDIVALMRTNIDVKTTTSAPPAKMVETFTVSFTAQSAAVATKVSNRLASLFIEQNLKVREQQVVGTADFFQVQLQKAKQDLDEKSQILAQLQAQYSNELPESQNLHLQALASSQLALRQEQDAVNQAQQQKTSLQTLLASSPQVINLDASSNSASAGLEEQLARLEGEMDQLRSHYGPNYPDVLSKAVEIQGVKDKMKALGEREKSTPEKNGKPGNPAIESQISQVDEQIRKHEAREAELTSQIKFHEAAIQRVPTAREKLTAATNDVAAASDRYKRLEDRKFGADMFSDVESRQEAERFVLLDPAQLPEKAVSPNRLLIDGIGAGTGLALALVLVTLFEISSPAVKTEREISERSGVPVFGTIPLLTAKSENRRRRVWTVVAATGNFLLAVGFFSVLAASVRK
jgi:polysaccharide chain length determinant protein (PEP-CTERM system associated)